MQPVNSGTGLHPGVCDSETSVFEERQREGERKGRRKREEVRGKGRSGRRWMGRIETTADPLGSLELKEGKAGPRNPSCSKSANK